MTIKSMTGFARAADAQGALAWQWEVRSVNGRGLDVRLRLVPGFEGLEGPARELIGKALQRGSVTASLTVNRQSGATEVRLNKPALEQVIAAAEEVRRRIGGEPIRVEGLLALKGVLEVVEPVENEGEAQSRNAQMLAGLGRALGGMDEARSAEGRRTAEVLREQLATVERLVNAAERLPGRTPEAARQRLSDQITRLLETTTSIDPARLAQEAALIAMRADVEEEIKRLKSHIDSARELVAAAGPHGRKLDFLAQEFNREANTLCSKSNDVELTRIGLELKAVIDQMREQVQNIE